MGGLLGACLARTGETVTMVVRPETLATHPPQLRLESPFGNCSVDVEWASTVPPADVVWIAVKATQLETALLSLGDAGSARAIVPLLNGIDHAPRLRSRYGDRVILATIAGETEKAGVGHIIHRSPFAVLNISARGRALLEETAGKLRATGFTCNFIDDETTLMWSKLVMLAPFALTTTAFDKAVGDIIANPENWALMGGSVRETCAAAKAEGATVDAETVLKIMKTFPPEMRSSMQKDVEHRRPPELDAIGGAVSRACRRHGLKSQTVDELIEQIERRIAGGTV